MCIRDSAYTVLIICVLNGQIGSGDFVFLFGAITGFSGWLNGISEKANDPVSYTHLDVYKRQADNQRTLHKTLPTG